VNGGIVVFVVVFDYCFCCSIVKQIIIQMSHGRQVSFAANDETINWTELFGATMPVNEQRSRAQGYKSDECGSCGGLMYLRTGRSNCYVTMDVCHNKVTKRGVEEKCGAMYFVEPAIRFGDQAPSVGARAVATIAIEVMKAIGHNVPEIFITE